MIYFVRAGKDGPIKIGRTVNGGMRELKHRLACMQSGNHAHLICLGVMPEERDLHVTFDDLLIRGEWFKPDERLLKYIERYAQNEPDKIWAWGSNSSYEPGRRKGERREAKRKNMSAV